MDYLRKTLPPLSSLLPFEATARLGSVTKAGDALGLTQAAVSKQIRILESDLGIKLFERRNRAVHLTQDGEAFAATVSTALNSLAGEAQSLRERERSEQIVLRSQLCEGLYWLMPRLSGFYQQHPEIDVRVAVSTKPLTEAEEPFDLAIQTTTRPTGPNRLLFSASDEIYPVCTPDYLEAMGGSLSLEHLDRYTLLHHRVDPQDWMDWATWLTEVGRPGAPGHRDIAYDSYPMMIQAMLEGHGIALAWRRTIERYEVEGTVERPFEESVLQPQGLSVYAPSNAKAKLGCAALQAWLRNELA